MRNNIIQLYPCSNKILIKSKGCYQYDADGDEYIDFESGVWCANLGHSHPRIVQIVEKQIKKSIHQGYRFRNTDAEQLSKELCNRIGFIGGASVFLSSGSEAVNLSITMSQKLTNRPKVLKISNSYLSAYGFGQIKPDNEHLVSVPYNNVDALSTIDYGDIAALVLETGGASIDVVRFPDYDFVHQLAAMVKKNDGYIIAEEVTTGFGRLGKWFGFQHYNIIPDMVVAGKALGNGYPVSSLTVNSELSAKLKKTPFVYAQSHQNDPLGCAIAREVIKVIDEENLIDNCVQMGNYFANRLLELKEAKPEHIKDVRAKGLMLAVEFQDTFQGDLLNEKLFESGFVFGFKKNTLRFLPPLIIGKQEIDKLILKLNEYIF